MPPPVKASGAARLLSPAEASAPGQLPASSEANAMRGEPCRPIPAPSATSPPVIPGTSSSSPPSISSPFRRCRRHRVKHLPQQVRTHRTLQSTQSTQSAQSVVQRLRPRYKYSEKIHNVRRASAQSPRHGTKNSRECRSRHLPGTFRLTGSGPRQGPPVPITSSCPRWSSWQPSEQQPLPKRPSGPSEQPSSCSRLP